MERSDEKPGTVVVLFYPPMFVICEAKPWPPDPLVGVVHASFVCALQRILVEGPGGQPMPKIGLGLMRDMDLVPDRWAGSGSPDQEEMREYESFRRQIMAQRANLVIAGPGSVRDIRGQRH